MVEVTRCVVSIESTQRQVGDPTRNWTVRITVNHSYLVPLCSEVRVVIGELCFSTVSLEDNAWIGHQFSVGWLEVNLVAGTHKTLKEFLKEESPLLVHCRYLPTAE